MFVHPAQRPSPQEPLVDVSHEDRGQRLRNLEPETGALLNLLLRTYGVRSVLELGTSNGYSTIWLGEAVAANGGRLSSVEMDSERAAQAARIGAPARPMLAEEQAGDAVAGLPARNARADGFDNAGAVGERHERLLGADPSSLIFVINPTEYC